MKTTVKIPNEDRENKPKFDLAMIVLGIHLPSAEWRVICCFCLCYTMLLNETKTPKQICW